MNGLYFKKYQEKIEKSLKRASLALFGHEEGGLNFRYSAEVEFYIPSKNKLCIKDELVDSVFQKICKIGEGYDIEIEKIEEEDGFNQFEIQTSPTKDHFSLAGFIAHMQKDALSGKLPINMFAKQEDVSLPSSGIHFHISLYDCNDINLFHSIEDNEDLFSHVFYYSVGGILAHMRYSMAFFAPTENCYKRFHPNLAVFDGVQYKNNPTTYSWGINNRTCAVRVPMSVTKSVHDTRFEHRVCSSMCKPYESILSIINSVCFGIVNKIMPPQKIFGDAFDPMYSERCGRMPIFLKDAISFSKSLEELMSW